MPADVGFLQVKGAMASKGLSKVTLKTWAAQDPGAVAINELKKELPQRARQLQIPEDGTVSCLYECLGGCWCVCVCWT